MGDMGEPCGSPAGIWKAWLVKSPSRRQADRLLVKEVTQLTSLAGQPWSWSRCVISHKAVFANSLFGGGRATLVTCTGPGSSRHNNQHF